MSNINFSKNEGETLRHDEWNALGDEFAKLENKIKDSKGTKINFPNDSKKFLNGEGEFSIPTLKPITVNQNVTVVKDNEDAKVEATETTEGITLSFSLPKGKQGDTGKTYVPSVSESGDLSWNLQDNPPQDENSTKIRGPQGERGRGLDVNYSKSGKTTTVNIITDEIMPETLKTFQINDGNDGHNPCLGRLNAVPDNLAIMFPDAVAGDYVYSDVYDDTTQTTTTTIYHYVLNGNTLEWDTGTVIDTENPTFASSQIVETVGIQDINGDNDPEAAGVLSAEAGKALKEKLYGAEDTNKYIELRLEDIFNVGFTNGVSASDNVCIVSSEAFAGKLCIVQGVKSEGYKKVKVDMTGKSRYGYVTFLKQSSLPSESTTYDGLVAGGYISSVHNSFDNMRFSCPNNQITELDIPSDAVAMFFTAKTTSEENIGSRLPKSITTEYGVNGGDLSSLALTEKETKEQLYVKGEEIAGSSALNGFIRNVTGRWAVSNSLKHAYIDVSGLQGSDIFVQNNEGDGAVATSIAFVTAQDTVSEVAIPSYLTGKYGIQRVANGVLGASELVHVPSGANYLYVYTGENNGARPKVFKAVPIKDILGTNNDSGTKRMIPLYPLYNTLHIGTDTGKILEPSGSYKMWVQPVSEGDKLLLAVTFSSSDKILCYGLYPTYGLDTTFPKVGDIISGFQKLTGVSGQTYNVEINATTDGFLVFSCATTNISKIDLYKEVELEGNESARILVGNKELHFTNAIESAAINETYGDIHDLYDDLVTNYGNAFRKQSDILNDTENNNVICRYTLGYEMGGLFSGDTSYDFDNSSSNEFYTGHHEKKKVLLNAGIHGDEKTAVYGLYNFCKCLLESNDAWAEYIKSNYIIDVIPIVCTENYMKNRRTTSDSVDPNRNFGLRTIVPVNAVAGFIDEHHSEYDFHVDCHNHSDHTEAGAKCFVSALRDGLYFDEILQFASRFAGVCKLGWDGMQTWKKNGGTPVSDPKLVMQTNASTSVLGASYTMAFPAYTRAYGIHSLTMETPRRLDNTNGQGICNKDAAKLTADMLIALLLYLA